MKCYDKYTYICASNRVYFSLNIEEGYNFDHTNCQFLSYVYNELHQANNKIQKTGLGSK